MNTAFILFRLPSKTQNQILLTHQNLLHRSKPSHPKEKPSKILRNTESVKLKYSGFVSQYLDNTIRIHSHSVLSCFLNNSCLCLYPFCLQVPGLAAHAAAEAAVRAQQAQGVGVVGPSGNIGPSGQVGASGNIGPSGLCGPTGCIAF